MGDNKGITPLSLRGNVYENWKLWRARFENYLVASEVSKKDEKTQFAQCLHYIGNEAFKIYTTFKFEDNEKGKLQSLLEKFEDHFLGRENIAYKRYKFFTYRQGENQTTDDFILEVKKLASKCKLQRLRDDLTLTVITCGIKNDAVREKLLQEGDITLDKGIEWCKVIENAESWSMVMGRGVQVKSKVDRIYRGSNNRQQVLQKRGKNKHPVNECPSIEKTSFYYNKFEGLSIKEKVRQLMELTQRSEDEVCLALHESDNDINMTINMLFEEISTGEWEAKDKKKKKRQALARIQDKKGEKGTRCDADDWPNLCQDWDDLIPLYISISVGNNSGAGDRKVSLGYRNNFEHSNTYSKQVKKGEKKTRGDANDWHNLCQDWDDLIPLYISISGGNNAGAGDRKVSLGYRNNVEHSNTYSKQVKKGEKEIRGDADDWHNLHDWDDDDWSQDWDGTMRSSGGNNAEAGDRNVRSEYRNNVEHRNAYSKQPQKM